MKLVISATVFGLVRENSCPGGNEFPPFLFMIADKIKPSFKENISKFVKSVVYWFIASSISSTQSLYYNFTHV